MELRGKRPRPHLDDKILAAWNGMMLSAFAKGAQILNEPAYAIAARRTADFLRGKLWNGELLRRYRDGEAAVSGFLDDYAFLANGLIDLYETEFDSADLVWAVELVEKACELFEDPAGGFFSTRAGQSDLVLRLKDDYDGAEPSGNSGIILALLRLARITHRDEFRHCAEKALSAFAPKMRQMGSGLPQMLVAQMFALAKPMEIILAGDLDAGLLKTIRSRFLPSAVVMRALHAPQAMPPLQGLPTVYVCENYSCQLPVSSVEKLEILIPKSLQ